MPTILLVLVVFAAFIPVLVVDSMLDNYVRGREVNAIQTRVDAITQDSQAAVHNAIQSLRRILSDSPSLCTPTFFENVNAELIGNLYLRQIVVENPDGVQYCAAFDTTISYRVLSESLNIPGHTEALSVVQAEGWPQPMLKITQKFGANRTVSAFVVSAPLLVHEASSLFSGLDYLQLSLTSGTPILSFGNRDPEMRKDVQDDMVARSFAGEIPIKAEAISSFSSARSGYAQLDVAFTIAASLVGILILVLALYFVRRSTLPSFDLERAIVAGEMKPYYQPVINLKTGRLIGCEVLIRWVKRSGEVVPPGAFIDYAEMSGLAIPMTLSLMEQVRVDLEELCRDVRDFKVSINLFEGHFRDGSIVEDIYSIFEGSGIDYRQLVFEITERRPLDDRAAANRIMSSMHKLGVRIALDDAGTGHSNLAYLQTLGIDIIKIDKIFVDMIKDANTPVPVIDGLIAMAKDMDIEIIAEGVETQEQALYLRAKEVYFAQGYLFAPPMKLSAFLSLAKGLKPEAKLIRRDRDIAA